MTEADNWDGTGHLPILYAKTADGAINVWKVWVEGCYVCMEWGQKDGAMQTGRYACAPKNLGRSNATTAEEQARLEAISRWKKQCKKKYFPDEGSAATGFNLKPMLAKGFRDCKKLTWPASLQPKFDGLRCLAYRKDGRVFLQSRGGDPYSVAHIAEELEAVLPDGLILDGELYSHGISLQQVNSLVRRPQPDSLLVEYHVYDVTMPDRLIPWHQRRDMLARWFSGFSTPLGSVHAVETWEVASEAEVKAHHDALVANGYEGAIVRLHHGLYKFGFRSGELLKFKEFQDDEFPIIGWTAGKGKFENAPILRCATKEGKHFDVVPKGTDEERRAMLENAQNLVGKLLTVRFFDWTDDGIPHFPVGVVIREPGT